MPVALSDASMNCMAHKKKPHTADRHKPSRTVRLPEVLASALEVYADEQVSNITEQVKIAVREYLERVGRWPPKPRT